jgi:hypothetical protein
VAGVSELQAKQQLEGFYRVISSIDVIAQEDVAGVWDLTPCLE